jgi:hypothetical protein
LNERGIRHKTRIIPLQRTGATSAAAHGRYADEIVKTTPNEVQSQKT